MKVGKTSSQAAQWHWMAPQNTAHGRKPTSER